MIKRMALMLAFVLLFLGGAFGWKIWTSMMAEQAMASMIQPPITVSTTVAAVDSWAPTVEAVGTLRAAQGVDITAQESGVITGLHFRSGAVVAAGDVLAQQYVDDDLAQLDALDADVRLSKLNLERTQELLDQNLASQFDYDSRKTDRDRNVADARNLRLKIDKKTIRAPFAGRIGIRQVDLGQFVEPGDPIVRLESLDHILIDFPVPQRAVGAVAVGQPLEIRVDAWPGEIFHGQITAIAPNVSETTRDLQLEGEVDNADERLLPGMFVGVSVVLPVREHVVTLPQSAITYNPYGDSVYVVKEISDDSGTKSLIAENKFVETGDTRGDQVAITKGVEAGETVVTAGQLKLRDGSHIVIDNSVPVGNDPHPVLENS